MRLRRHRRGEDRAAAAQRDPDLRAGARADGAPATRRRAACASPPTSAGAVRESQVIFIAVGTPPGEDGSADLQHVLAVAEGIGRAMDGPRIIVTKTTVPVGTARAGARGGGAVLRARRSHVCSNPEFLKEGAAIDDFMKPDRVVVGVDDDRCAGGDARAVRALRAHRQSASSSWTSRRPRSPSTRPTRCWRPASRS